MLQLLLFIILLGLPLEYVLLSLFFAKKQPKNLPNGSMGWPIIGETIGFLKPHKSNSIGTFLQDRCSRYGKVFKSHIFGHPTIVSCDYELNMFILQNEEKLFQCCYPKAVHDILGDLCTLLVLGDVHKRLRNVIVGFTSACKFNPKFYLDIDKLARSFVENWKNREVIDFVEHAKKFTFDLMIKQVLDLEPGDPQASMILKDFLTFMRGVISVPLYIPGTPYTKAVKARARICASVSNIIKARKGELRNDKRDYLDVVLSNKSLNDEEKVSMVLDLLLGSYDTTSVLIAITVYFLGQSPNVLEKVKEEHQAIRKRKGKEPLDLKDYKEMNFTQKVVLEALRCGNVVKFVHRKALKDVHYKGYFIPSGWKVLPIATAVHLDPSNHKDALKFDPWRWTEQEKEMAFSPFGGGPRLCPGADIAKIVTAFFLHHLVLNYRFQTNEENYPLAHPYVEFKKGFPVRIEST